MKNSFQKDCRIMKDNQELITYDKRTLSPIYLACLHGGPSMNCHALITNVHTVLIAFSHELLFSFGPQPCYP